MAFVFLDLFRFKVYEKEGKLVLNMLRKIISDGLDGRESRLGFFSESKFDEGLSVENMEVSGVAKVVLTFSNGAQIIKGSADDVKAFYRSSDTPVSIVNVAKRIGSNTVQSMGNMKVYWFPMQEYQKVVKCKLALDSCFEDLKATLLAGNKVVINCQEGMHRSVEFFEQFKGRLGI